MPELDLKEKPKWFTERMVKDGWEVIGPGVIAHSLKLDNGPEMVLVVEKTPGGWQSSCRGGACGLKNLPASWSIMILHADGSPILTSKYRIAVELVQEYILTGKQHSTKHENGHDGVPVAAYGVWFETDNVNKDIKVLYTIISGNIENPIIWAKGELGFYEQAERVLTD
jgi:hypothetical protein